MRMRVDFPRGALGGQERGVLGMKPGDACEAYCRVRIPQDDPGAAGFDFSRLIVVCPRTGLALEKEGEGQPLVPFRSAAGR